MDERVSDLFGSGNGLGSGSSAVASNAKSGNGHGAAGKKASKNKKSKAHYTRNFKPSNNTPYLPPEVRRTTEHRWPAAVPPPLATTS